MSETARVAPLPSRALIRLTGADWRSFLHGQISQDVESLKPGELRFAALLTPQGRLAWDLFVAGVEDGALVEVAADRREALIQRLTLYRLRAKVEIAPDPAPVSAMFGGAPAGDGWFADPRLPSLGWRGYGATAPAGGAPASE